MIPEVRPATTSFGRSRRTLYFLSASVMGKFDSSTFFMENLEHCLAIISFTVSTTAVLSSGCLYWDSKSETFTGLRSLMPTSSMLPVLVDAKLRCDTGNSRAASSSFASEPTGEVMVCMLMITDQFRDSFLTVLCN